MKTIEEFIKEIEGSADLQNELKAVMDKDKDALAEFLKKHDVSGTIEDYTKAVQAKAEAEGAISDDDVGAVAGGSFEEVSPPKYPCPKCGSWNVKNTDPGIWWQMRVICYDCSFRGPRDGQGFYYP